LRKTTPSAPILEEIAVDGGTRVDMRADGVPPGISAVGHADDSSSMANLALYLAGLSAT